MASYKKSATAESPSAPPAGFDPTTAKVVKQVTVPLHKLKVGDVIYVKVMKAIELAKEMRNKKPGDEDKKPPHLMQIIDLQTGALENIIIGMTLVDEFNDSYPGESYVGRGFKIAVLEQKQTTGGGGKRYNTYAITEIEIPE